MFNVEQATQALQQRVAELEAQIATRKQEIEQGMLVERELSALIAERDAAQQRLAEHEDESLAPEA